MQSWLGKWWPWCKAFFAVAILVAIGWRFARDLQSPELWNRTFHVPWLIAAGVLYILGLGCSLFFWYRLLRSLGQEPAVPASIRAFYMGLLGKYLPGKAWALVLRAAFVRGPKVRLGVATFTSFYEVFTTMASGVLLAAILFAVLLPSVSPALDWPIARYLFSKNNPEPAALDRNGLILLSLVLLVVVGTPLLPPIFNRIVYRLASLNPAARKAGAAADSSLPRIQLHSLPEGLILTAGDWLLMGASLWAVLQAILGEAQPWSWDVLGRDTAYVALAYVAGFAFFIVPSGIGVREFFLVLFLTPELRPLLGETEGRRTALLAVLLLRLVWTAAEVVICGIVYWLPGPALTTIEQEANHQS